MIGYGGSRDMPKGGNGVFARCSQFPRGHVSDPHRHDEAQFVCGAGGTMIMLTDDGALAVPPNSAAWIPAGMVHNARMIGSVSTMTLWIEESPRRPLPEKCQVVSVSPLMRQLFLEAMKFSPHTRADSRADLIVGHLLTELEMLPALPAQLPLPKEPQLAACCQSFLRKPSAHQTIDQWSAMLRVSRRTFTRLFRQETGLSFAAWRQQACLFAALPRLAAGDSITTIAVDLGYDSPAAFTTMFKRQQGVPPSRCFR